MNERIRELADQCRTEYRDGHGGFTEQFDEEKFAELIIEECAEIFEGLYTDQQRPERIDTRIKRHFGVG